MSILLKRNTNQVRGLAEYAQTFMKSGKPSEAVLKRVKLFHTDSVICGVSALALRTNAPFVLKQEATQILAPSTIREFKAKCFGSAARVEDVKAFVANIAAVREWDANGTVFGYRAGRPGFQAGEFGHNDFYPVVIGSAIHNEKLDGAEALKAMVLLDEIRGRLAEVFSLKTYKIDHVVHGAIASAVVYGVLHGATVEQIEAGVGMFVAHYVPFRAIRAGHQLSDSKGASAALSTEAAIVSMKRAMKGFVGPKDIFRNPEAIFRYFTKTNEFEAPFDLELGLEGDDFAVMGMHFKLGIYEHQSAGAIHGLLELILKDKFIKHNDFDSIQDIKIVAYEPAFGIIGDPHKRNPTTRQSADHSMVYIISTLLNKAISTPNLLKDVNNLDDLWKKLILLPTDYGKEALNNPHTRALMKKISFEHGGPEFDKKYPDGIPTQIKITADSKTLDSGLVMYPAGHARNTEADLEGILANKFEKFGRLALSEAENKWFIGNLDNIATATNHKLTNIYSCKIKYAEESIDGPEVAEPAAH